MESSSSSLLCSSNSLSPSLSLSLPRIFPALPFRDRCCGGSLLTSPSVSQVPLNCSKINRPKLSPLYSTATQEIAETIQSESEFVEIGYICSVHGLQGEVRVKTNTDFPELRFSRPGRRWLRQQVLGREKVQEVELVEGRGHPGQKGWIVRFNGIDTVEQAQQLVGSTVLVTEDSRPELEEGEFYTRDLVGMRVVLKETGEHVGTVVNIFNSGASDLLHVMLNSSIEMHNGTGKATPETSATYPLVWVPFVEAIVPDVDMNKGEMLITPPKGLLELNIRADERSKKERRQLEWKQRKKFQKRLIAAKKKLCEMEQQHVFHGFRVGEKAQGRLLADQIVGLNSKLLQLALQNIEISSKRWSLPEFIKANLTTHMRSTFKVSEDSITTGNGEKLSASSKLRENSRLLTSEGKVAIVLFADDSDRVERGSDSGLNLVDSEQIDSSCGLLQTLFSEDEKLVKIEERESVPLILVCPSNAISSLQNLFSENDYFAFDSKKVWILEEEKLPVVSNSLEGDSKHKILMKSPWEMLQTPVGSGGVISLLSSDNILENLGEMGVEYFEVFRVNQRYDGRESLLGLVHSSGAHVGIQMLKDIHSLKENFHMIFSLNFMKQLTNQINKLQFYAVSNPNSHVEKVDEEWVDIEPSTSNSYELRCSIYSSLNACPPSKVCVLEVTE